MSDIASWVSQMLIGCELTIELFAITFIFSIPLGLILSFVRIAKCPKSPLAKAIYHCIEWIVSGFILIMRGTPLMLQIFFVYFGLPYIPVVGEYLTFDRFPAGAIAFVLNYGAYYAEIFRGGLLSVDKGQYEASKVLGLTPSQTRFRIVLPQMFRIALPSVANETIILLKDTALITAIGLSDLLKVTTNIVNRTTNISAFAVAAVFYLIFSYILTVVFQRLEKKFEF